MRKTAYELRISDWSSDGCSSDPLRSRNTTHSIIPIESAKAIAQQIPVARYNAIQLAASTVVSCPISVPPHRACRSAKAYRSGQIRAIDPIPIGLGGRDRAKPARQCALKENEKTDKGMYQPQTKRK